MKAPSGFTLVRMETLNWGNFQNWQRIELAGSTDTCAHSLIAGVNGSGKSTLIDGIMTVLLPFKQSLHLGVTHDYEQGSAGSRSIDDYLLGKYAANSGESVDDDLVFSRDKGVSCIVLVFRHNQKRDHWVSIARMWWYAGHKIREDSAGIIAHANLSIGRMDDSDHMPNTANPIPNASNQNSRAPDQKLDTNRRNSGAYGIDLCDAEGHVYASLATLKRGLAQKSERVQVFDKLNQYFESLRKNFGGVSRDDLKLLNRAFYLKSIGHIDRFIRDYMLVEQECEATDRLIQHVDQASQISRDIERCELKLADVNRILNSVQRYRQDQVEILELQLEARLIRIYEEYINRREGRRRLTETSARIRSDMEHLPGLQANAERADEALASLEAELAGSEAGQRIESLDKDRKAAEKQLDRLYALRESVRAICDDLGLEKPVDRTKLPAFEIACEEKQVVLESDRQTNDAERKKILGRQGKIEADVRELREEIEFLGHYGTIIPSSFYAIKTNCIAALKLQEIDLLFVGELIRVKDSRQKYRRAVEAALAPIARNLLCAPKHLDAVTEWINRERLQQTTVIRRIQPMELEPTTRKEIHPHSILAQIELRSHSELAHPFEEYLWNWLSRNYYHRIVDPAEFRTGIECAVTLEGLVKTDGRTQRKYKENMDYSLGWDNKARQQELIARLLRLNTEYDQILTEINHLDEKTRVLNRAMSHLEHLSNLGTEYLDIESTEKSAMEISIEIERLKNEDRDLKALRELRDQSRVERDRANRDLIEKKASIDRDRADLERIQNNIDNAHRSIEEHVHAVYGDEQKSLNERAPDWEQRLDQLEKTLTRQKISRIQHENSIEDKLGKLTHSRQSIPIQNYLDRFQEEHADPNLPYAFQAVRSLEEIDQFLLQWQEARRHLEETGLPRARSKWEQFYNNTLIEAVKSAINEIRKQQEDIKNNIQKINLVLRGIDFERLPDYQTYLRIEVKKSADERILRFLREVKQVEQVVSGEVRAMEAGQKAKHTMATLEPFVQSLTENAAYKTHVTDVRNHHAFLVHALRRSSDGNDGVMERFSGAKKDSKSSAQTTQLAYTLLASSLAYRFHFHDPSLGRNSLRIIILDEFAGKFDTDKPRDIVRLLNDMGFQAVLVSPLSKADILAEFISRLVFVHKVSSSESKTHSHTITSRADYDRIISEARHPIGDRHLPDDSSHSMQAMDLDATS